MADDSDLLHRYCEDGSQTAFTELVERHVDLVYTVALRKTRGNPHLAQDAAQVVFTDLARKAHSLKAHPVLSAWLFKSAHFAATNLMREERRRHHREQQGLAMHELLTDSVRPIDWEKVRPVINDAISGLNERDREAVMLRFFHRLEFSEIGARLNLTAEGARARVGRALDRLQSDFKHRGITSTSAAVGAALGEGAMIAAPSGLAAGIATIVATSVGTVAAGTGASIGAAAFAVSSINLPLAFAAAAVVVVGGVVYQVQSRQNELIGAKPASLAAAETSRSGDQSAGHQSSLPPQSPVTPIAKESESDPGLAAGDAFLQKNPGAKAVLATSQRARMAASYFPLYVELGFDDAKAAAFEEIVCNGMTDSHGSGSLKLRAFPKLSEAERVARLRVLLGEKAFERYIAYDHVGTTLVMTVAAGLYFTDTPLTTSQGERLAVILSEVLRRAVQTGEEPRFSWAEIFERARAVLGPTQFQPLEVMRAEAELSWKRRMVGQAVSQKASSALPSRPAASSAISLEVHLEQNANNLEIQLLVLAHKRLQFTQRCGPFFQTCGLSSEQINQFGDALARRVELHEDLDEVGRRQKIFLSSTIKTQHEVVEDSFAAEISNIIGTDSVALFRDYERMQLARSFVSKLAGVAAVSGIPFSRQQADSLTRIIADCSLSYVTGGMVSFYDIDWATAEKNAGEILSPYQLRIFRRVDPPSVPSRWYSEMSMMLRPNVRRAPFFQPWR